MIGNPANLACLVGLVALVGIAATFVRFVYFDMLRVEAEERNFHQSVMEEDWVYMAAVEEVENLLSGAQHINQEEP